MQHSVRLCCHATLRVLMLSCNAPSVYAVMQRSGCLCCYATLWVFTSLCNILCVYAVTQMGAYAVMQRSGCLCRHATLWVFMLSCNTLGVYIVMQHSKDAYSHTPISAGPNIRTPSSTSNTLVRTNFIHGHTKNQLRL